MDQPSLKRLLTEAQYLREAVIQKANTAPTIGVAYLIIQADKNLRQSIKFLKKAIKEAGASDRGTD